MEQITRAIPVPQLSRSRNDAAWRFLKPERDRPGITVMLIYLNEPGRRPGLRIDTFSLFVSHHASAVCWTDPCSLLTRCRLS